MQDQNLVIEIKGKYYTLIPLPFDENIDIADFLKIDHSNIFGEMATMPLIVNQIANLKAELNSLVSQQKTGLKILSANLIKEYKSSMLGSKTTVADTENYVLLNEQYQKEEDRLNQLQKQYDYMDGFYWSAQAKVKALEKLSSQITPNEFSAEVLEKSLNNVLIKKFNGKI